jgi:hypothetical protein
VVCVVYMCVMCDSSSSQEDYLSNILLYCCLKVLHIYFLLLQHQSSERERERERNELEVFYSYSKRERERERERENVVKG